MLPGEVRMSACSANGFLQIRNNLFRNQRGVASVFQAFAGTRPDDAAFGIDQFDRRGLTVSGKADVEQSVGFFFVRQLPELGGFQPISEFGLQFFGLAVEEKKNFARLSR